MLVFYSIPDELTDAIALTANFHIEKIQITTMLLLIYCNNGTTDSNAIQQGFESFCAITMK